MEIEKLKKALDKSSLSIQSCKNLMGIRERLHDEILELKKEIEKDLIRLHHAKDKGQKESLHQIKSIIVSKSEKLSSVKKEMQKIDHQIDEIGDMQEETLENLKKEILVEIEKIYPDCAVSYRVLESKLEEKKLIEKELTALRKCLIPFYEHLKEGNLAKRKRGFWNIIFGRHPKVLISNAIRKAELEAEKIEGQVKHKKIHTFLERFLIEVRKNWNHALYNEKFFSFVDEFQNMMDELDDEIEQLECEKLDLKEKMNRLIEECVIPK